MGAIKRLLFMFCGMLVGYAIASYIIYEAHRNIDIYPWYIECNIFTALTSGHFWDWIKWNFLHESALLTWVFVIIFGLIALALADRR